MRKTIEITRKNAVKLMCGDNLELLKGMPDNCVDSVVTDPPYALNFMNKKWDAEVPSVEFWKEVYRVLKPGGHVLSFGGTRTYHRMTVNIEDAGFEIRDQIMWLYGSGFPKSHNIGKSVDKIRGNEREVVGDNPNHRTTTGLLELGFQDGKPTSEITKGTSEYEGWGTALKPANEPICVARKPLSEKTVAANVLKWGTGGINIDGCRIKIEGKDDRSAGIRTATFGSTEYVSGGNGTEPYVPNEEGRFPANIILDEEAGMALDEQSGVSSSKKRTNFKKDNTIWQENTGDVDTMTGGFADKGGASRFFYCPKVSKKERNAGCDDLETKKLCQGGYESDWSSDKEGDIGINKVKEYKNNHPTVKPVDLMAYLCRLITPPQGLVLDPFMGSGSTGRAAIEEGFRFAGMEMDKDYFEIAQKRIEYSYKKTYENGND